MRVNKVKKEQTNVLSNFNKGKVKMQEFYEEKNYSILKCFNGYCLNYIVKTTEKGRLLTIEKYQYDLWNNKKGDLVKVLTFHIDKDEYETFHKICNKDWDEVEYGDKKNYDFELVNKTNEKLIVKGIGTFRCSYTIVNGNDELTIDYNGSSYYSIDELVRKDFR